MKEVIPNCITINGEIWDLISSKPDNNIYVYKLRDYEGLMVRVFNLEYSKLIEESQQNG